MDKKDNCAAKLVGRKIKSIRVLLGLTQDEVAQKAGIRRETLITIESGRYNTGIRQIYDIMEAMGYDIQFVPMAQPTNR